MLAKMLRASRQNRALLRNTRNLLTNSKRNFSDESSVAAHTPGSAAASAPVDPNSPVRNLRSTIDMANIVR